MQQSKNLIECCILYILKGVLKNKCPPEAQLINDFLFTSTRIMILKLHTNDTLVQGDFPVIDDVLVEFNDNHICSTANDDKS